MVSFNDSSDVDCCNMLLAHVGTIRNYSAFIAMEEARQIIQNGKNDMKSVNAVLDYLKELLTIEGRKNWKPPKNSVYGTQINSFLEEIFHLSLAVLKRGAKSVTFRIETYKKVSSYLFYAAAQLELLDELPRAINSVFMCTEQFDILIPFFIKTNNEKAIQSILTSHFDSLNDSQLLTCIKTVVHDRKYQRFCLNLLPKIRENFPSETAQIESFCLFDKSDTSTYAPALQILEKVIENNDISKKDYLLFYNASPFLGFYWEYFHIFNMQQS